MQHNQKGFTLVELMIVIAMIGPLAAVAIPNFLEYLDEVCSSEDSTTTCSLKIAEDLISSINSLDNAEDYFTEAPDDGEFNLGNYEDYFTEAPDDGEFNLGNDEDLNLGEKTPTPTPNSPPKLGLQGPMQGAVNSQLGGFGMTGLGTFGSGLRTDPAQNHTPQNVPLTIILER